MISEIEGFVIDFVRIQENEIANTQLMCVLMLTNFSRIAVQSLDRLKTSNINIRRRIVDDYKLSREDNLNEIPVELLEAYAHSYGVNRTISLIETWLSQ